MTDKEKLEKIKVFADAMYDAAFNITTDASHLKKAMYDYHMFVIYGLHKEEPVSIWHNMDEVPIKGKVIVVQTKDTFYGLSVQKGGSTYKNRNKDRYIKWAYASDLLNLSNVQRDAKNWKYPVSNDLEEVATKYAQDKHLPVQTWQAFKAGAQWQKEHLWKDAQGDDLPEIDKEVIALIETFGHYKVIFAHRVDENAEIHTSIDGKPLVLHPKKHGKGGWNIPNIKWWLDYDINELLCREK